MKIHVHVHRAGKTTDAEGEKGGRWVTLNGAHVFINSKGEPTKGPEGLVQAMKHHKSQAGYHQNNFAEKGFTHAESGHHMVAHSNHKSAGEWLEHAQRYMNEGNHEAANAAMGAAKAHSDAAMESEAKLDAARRDREAQEIGKPGIGQGAGRTEQVARRAAAKQGANPDDELVPMKMAGGGEEKTHAIPKPPAGAPGGPQKGRGPVDLGDQRNAAPAKKTTTPKPGPGGGLALPTRKGPDGKDVGSAQNTQARIDAEKAAASTSSAPKVQGNPSLGTGISPGQKVGSGGQGLPAGTSPTQYFSPGSKVRLGSSAEEHEVVGVSGFGANAVLRLKSGGTMPASKALKLGASPAPAAKKPAMSPIDKHMAARPKPGAKPATVGAWQRKLNDLQAGQGQGAAEPRPQGVTGVISDPNFYRMGGGGWHAVQGTGSAAMEHHGRLEAAHRLEAGKATSPQAKEAHMAAAQHHANSLVEAKARAMGFPGHGYDDHANKANELSRRLGHLE